ncbi:MAG: 3-oxoacyl-[acyl-carrier-protein] synthase III C-terminal domain-containing protein [Bacteroidota bacterium]
MDWKSRFESIGVKIPEKRLSTQELVKKIKIPGFSKFGLHTGISERRVCSAGEDSFSLAHDAAKDCLSYSKYRPDELDMIISCSITRYKDGLSHLYEPTFSILLKDSIGADKAITFDISNACAGMMTGVYIAENYIRLGIIRTCMIVSGEYITNISDHAIKNIKTPLCSEISSLTVGDCGAAVILERAEKDVEGLIISGFATLGRYSNLCIGRQNFRTPGGNMKTKAKKIHQVSITNSTPIVKNALEKSGLSFDKIDYLIPHQTSRSSILSGANHYSGYFREKPGHIVINLKDTGNTASTTHFLALYQYLSDKRFKEGDRIMLLCFASGLVVGVVIFKMNEMVYRYGNKN